MGNQAEGFLVSQFTPEGKRSIEVTVAKEFAVTIVLNNQEIVTLLCSPKNLDYLAVGYLYSEGLLKSKDEIRNIMVDEQRGVVRLYTMAAQEIAQDLLFKQIITSGGGRGASFYSAADAENQKVRSEMKISTEEVFALVNEFQHSSEVYSATRGVHSAALADGKRILMLIDDIGRQNAIDKIFGKCLLENLPTNDKLLITSGRVSSETMHKAAKRGIPIIVSISVPTNLGVKLAADLGITLIGSVKGKKMNVYANDWRIEKTANRKK